MLTSWEKVQPIAQAWDLRKTYDAAWEVFSDQIADTIVNPVDIEEFTAQFDLVISTIPAWSICLRPQEHYFESISTLVQKNMDFANFPALADLGENWVVYNGTHDYAWYRASNIFGHTSVEARSAAHLVMNKNWEPGFKIVGTDCDCHPTVVKTGRMGRWERGVLTHHAFEQTVEAIVDRFGSLF